MQEMNQRIKCSLFRAKPTLMLRLHQKRCGYYKYGINVMNPDTRVIDVLNKEWLFPALEKSVKKKSLLSLVHLCHLRLYTCVYTEISPNVCSWKCGLKSSVNMCMNPQQ